MAFYDKLISLCAKKGVSPSGVAREIGLSNAAANGWKKGKKPSDVTLEKLSQYFNVPVSDLTGESDTKKESPSLISKDERERYFLDLFRQLSPEQQEREIAYLQSQSGAAAGKGTPSGGQG